MPVNRKCARLEGSDDQERKRETEVGKRRPGWAKGWRLIEGGTNQTMVSQTCSNFSKDDYPAAQELILRNDLTARADLAPTFLRAESEQQKMTSDAPFI